jgi:hypothetical protein
MKKNLLLLGLLIILALAAYFIYQKNSSSTLAGKPLSDFAIEDTSSVNKIFIADKQGGSVLLERVPGQRYWKLNGKYLARKDALDLLLATVSRLHVKGVLPESGRDNMMRVLASSAKKVEIYQGGDEPSKIYYIGTSTPDHMGTIMLLEIPGIGRSDEPYITYMEGFTGFLTPRFFADENEWRYTGMFDYPNLEFSQVDVIDNMNPETSFCVQYRGGNAIAMQTGYNVYTNAFSSSVPVFDTLKVKEFLIRMKKVHFDSYRTYLKPEAVDSINKTVPAYTIQVHENSGSLKKVDLYKKRAAKRFYDENGNESPWDMDFFWAKTGEGEMALAQRFVFSPLVAPLGFYLKPTGK